MSASRAVQFWFEFASTYSYPAAMRVEAAARAAGCELRWKPFLLGPLFRAQGWNDSPFNIYPAKGRYMWRDLERICAELELPFRRPSVFPRNGLLAARVACALAGSGGTEGDSAWLPAFARNVYSANFARDEDISSAGVLRECLPAQVTDPDAVFAAAQSDEVKTRLRRQTEQAVELGIFGAPSFVAGGELFWGNDRLEAALAWARR